VKNFNLQKYDFYFKHLTGTTKMYVFPVQIFAIILSNSLFVITFASGKNTYGIETKGQ
jgi:hypothetical protein